jgi:hypothetical protein
VFRNPNGHKEKKDFSGHVIVKMISTQNKKRIPKASREMYQLIYKRKLTRITANISEGTLKARKGWTLGLESKQLQTKTPVP